MNKKLLVVLIVAMLALAACKPLAAVGIGEEPVDEEMDLQEIVAEPTKAVLEDKGNYYRDDMDWEDPNDDWGLKVVIGLENDLIWSKLGGKFRLETINVNDVEYLFLNKNNRYEDVVVEAQVENIGPTDAAFALVCRASEAGWYEFRVSPSGYYEFLRYDQYMRDSGKNAYNSLFEKERVNTNLVNIGTKTNVFSLSCVGNQITAFVNGEQLYYERRPLAIEDETYTDGAIGFGIRGYGREYDMVFDWVEAKKP